MSRVDTHKHSEISLAELLTLPSCSLLSLLSKLGCIWSRPTETLV